MYGCWMHPFDLKWLLPLEVGRLDVIPRVVGRCLRRLEIQTLNRNIDIDCDISSADFIKTKKLFIIIEVTYQYIRLQFLYH